MVSLIKNSKLQLSYVEIKKNMCCNLIMLGVIASDLHMLLVNLVTVTRDASFAFLNLWAILNPICITHSSANWSGSSLDVVVVTAG